MRVISREIILKTMTFEDINIRMSINKEIKNSRTKAIDKSEID